ncbi:hypothetical protein KAR91_53595 [Candidatus Pacearchaeota archaeon]|nr:hypothetical protein [Candidatus Pacearchaeota archaeon]
MKIPDPVEIMEQRQDRLGGMFIDEHTCMECGAKVDHELICMSPMGDGPAVCETCAGPEAVAMMEECCKPYREATK